MRLNHPVLAITDEEDNTKKIPKCPGLTRFLTSKMQWINTLRRKTRLHISDCFESFCNVSHCVALSVLHCVASRSVLIVCLDSTSRMLSHTGERLAHCTIYVMLLCTLHTALSVSRHIRKFDIGIFGYVLNTVHCCKQINCNSGIGGSHLTNVSGERLAHCNIGKSRHNFMIQICYKYDTNMMQIWCKF